MKWLALALGLLAILGGIVYLIYRRNKVKQLEELENQIEDAATITTEVADLEFETEESKMRSQVGKLVDRKPDEVAQLLRSWLNE